MTKDTMLDNIINKFGFEHKFSIQFASLMAILTDRGAASLYNDIIRRKIIDPEEE